MNGRPSVRKMRSAVEGTLDKSTQLVDLLPWITTFTRSHLRHESIAIARDAIQRHAEHFVHLAVRLSRLEKRMPEKGQSIIATCYDKQPKWIYRPCLICLIRRLASAEPS
jgi:hypothetical protein